MLTYPGNDIINGTNTKVGDKHERRIFKADKTTDRKQSGRKDIFQLRFSDIAGSETIRRSLNRFTQEGCLRRIMNGVYEKPKYSQLLHEYLAVDPDAVAKAIARNYHWTISPCGDAAWNLLGLSAQVPSVWVYISDGPYRKYPCGNITIEFRHRTNREISGLSYKTRLLVQALKELGKERITQEIVKALSDKLTSEEKTAALKEAAESTDRLYDAIRKICEDNKE